MVSDDANVLTPAEARAFNTSIMEQVIQDIYDELELVYIAGCEDDTAINGQWVTTVPLASQLSAEYYRKYRGLSSVNSYTPTQVASLSEEDDEHNDVGWCIMSASQQQCLAINNATWEGGRCVLPNAWYLAHCTNLGGTWYVSGSTGTCTIDPSTYTLDPVIH